MNKIEVKFTKRQLELIQYACEVSQDGRRVKDAEGMKAIVIKLYKLGIINRGID